MAYTEVFEALKGVLEPYVQRGLTVTADDETSYELVSMRPVEIEGRKMDRMYFVGIRNGKTAAVLHYFPIYCVDLAPKLDPALRKLLKGKTCFNFKKIDEPLLQAVREALDIGFDAFREKGWL